MNVTDMQSVQDRYAGRVGNLDKILHISLAREPRMFEILLRAVDTGTALTSRAVERVFSPISWEE